MRQKIKSGNSAIYFTLSVRRSDNFLSQFVIGRFNFSGFHGYEPRTDPIQSIQGQWGTTEFCDLCMSRIGNQRGGIQDLGPTWGQIRYGGATIDVYFQQQFTCL